MSQGSFTREPALPAGNLIPYNIVNRVFPKSGRRDSDGTDPAASGHLRHDAVRRVVSRRREPAGPPRGPPPRPHVQRPVAVDPRGARDGALHGGAPAPRPGLPAVFHPLPPDPAAAGDDGGAHPPQVPVPRPERLDGYRRRGPAGRGGGRDSRADRRARHLGGPAGDGRPRGAARGIPPVQASLADRPRGDPGGVRRDPSPGRVRRLARNVHHHAEPHPRRAARRRARRLRHVRGAVLAGRPADPLRAPPDGPRGQRMVRLGGAPVRHRNGAPAAHLRGGSADAGAARVRRGGVPPVPPLLHPGSVPDRRG